MASESPIQDELELLCRVGQGDRQAFSALYDRYSGVFFSTLLRLLNDRHEAEDVLQDAFLQIWEGAARFNPKLGKPFNWALTITRNKAIDRLRARQQRPALASDTPLVSELEPSTTPGPADGMDRDERASLVRSAMRNLPKPQQLALEMAFFKGMTQQQVAEALQEPLGTIKARIRRGMQKLRTVLENDESHASALPMNKALHD